MPTIQNLATDQDKELAAILGDDGLSTDSALLEEYARDLSTAPRILPRYVARPGKAAQVQRLVAWAKETATPLVPVSSGGPHRYGDTVPSVAEAVIVDLSRMKGILRIDRRNRIAVVEPGVTYAELEPALAADGLRMSRPLLPRRNKSVVASLLERQPTTIPRLNYSLPEPLRVCGVVWGTGDLAFTGEGGTAAASLEAQWEAGLAQVNPQGPLATDLMRLLTGAQGTMGMVVWASIKCQLLPAVQKRLVVSAPALGDLIEFCRQAERLKLGDELMMLNRARLGGAVEWSVLIGAAGTALFPREKLELQEKELGALASQCGLALEEAGAELGSWFDGYAEDAEPSHDIFFLCTLDAAPGYVESVLAMAGKAGYAPERIGVYIQPQHQGVSQHVEFRIPYNPAERKDAALAERLFLEASEALISQGAYFSRPYGPWADWVYSRDATASRVLRTVKRIADPCNIMNPGKLCF